MSSSGTGASAIYPLLFSQIDDSIRMICSGKCQRHLYVVVLIFSSVDIDEASLAAAKGNIRQNQLESRIQIMAQVPEAPLFTKATNLMSRSVRGCYSFATPPDSVPQSRLHNV